MLIRIAYQSPRSRLEFAGGNHCLRHLDWITDKNLFAMKRNRATEIAYRRVLIDFHGSSVVRRTRNIGSGSAGFDQRDLDAEFRDFRNDSFKESFNTPLRGRIDTHARIGHLTLLARDLQDSATVLLAHLRNNGFREYDASQEIGIKQTLNPWQLCFFR